MHSGIWCNCTRRYGATGFPTRDRLSLFWRQDTGISSRDISVNVNQPWWKLTWKRIIRSNREVFQVKVSLGENIDYSATSGIQTQACPWDATDVAGGKQGSWIRFSRPLLVYWAVYSIASVCYRSYTLHTFTRYTEKVYPQKKQVHYLGLGHPKDCAKFYFYVVLLKKMLLKYKVDMTHDYTTVC